MKNKNILYLLGSGRSGTTLIATVLNSTKQIKTLGELHQFYSYTYNDKLCSCGETISSCEYWGETLKKMNIENEKLKEIETKQNYEEKHKFIPFILLGKKPSNLYQLSQRTQFEFVENHNKKWLLDSSKYISRFLLLKKTTPFNLKGIYVVRDVRGVIHSFEKKVQTPKKPFSTILYYILTNAFGQLICWVNKDVIKLKYEDFIENTPLEIQRIYKCLLNENYNIEYPTDSFKIEHLIGGNRLKKNKAIKINKDFEWKNKISRSNQIFYYILCLPFMLINRYKI